MTARQISSSAVADAEFRHSDLLPTGQDDTPYRLITTEGVSTFEANGRTFLKVAPEALRTWVTCFPASFTVQPSQKARTARGSLDELTRVSCSRRCK